MEMWSSRISDKPTRRGWRRVVGWPFTNIKMRTTVWAVTIMLTNVRGLWAVDLVEGLKLIASVCRQRRPETKLFLFVAADSAAVVI